MIQEHATACAPNCLMSAIVLNVMGGGHTWVLQTARRNGNRWKVEWEVYKIAPGSSVGQVVKTTVTLMLLLTALCF